MTTLTILQGLPGSGKNHVGDMIARETDAVVVSSDDYPGLYTRNPDGTVAINMLLQGPAHGETFHRVYALLKRGQSVVIANTNLTQAEVAPYVLMGQAFSVARIELVTVVCDPTVAQARNTHGVPARVYGYMIESLKAFTHADHWKYVPGFSAREVVNG
jgi:predicted kinase